MLVLLNNKVLEILIFQGSSNSKDLKVLALILEWDLEIAGSAHVVEEILNSATLPLKKLKIYLDSFLEMTNCKKNFLFFYIFF
jgi:hypothetical protein